MNNEYLTIAEFAKAAGISKQKVYSLRQEYSKYFSVIHNKQKVSSLLLELLQGEDIIENSDYNLQQQTTEQISIDKPEDETTEADNNISAAEETTTTDKPNNEYITFLQQQIIDLRQEVKEKDKQLSEYHSRITSLLEKQQELTEKALQTTGQAQLLQAADKLPKEAVIEAAAIEKKSIWQRLFNK